MRFYHIEQYGRRIICHKDKAYNTEEGLREVCSRIVAKAKKATKQGLMVEGMFNVIICNIEGKELDTFICGTDFKY